MDEGEGGRREKPVARVSQTAFLSESVDVDVDDGEMRDVLCFLVAILVLLVGRKSNSPSSLENEKRRKERRNCNIEIEVDCCASTVGKRRRRNQLHLSYTLDQIPAGTTQHIQIPSHCITWIGRKETFIESIEMRLRKRIHEKEEQVAWDDEDERRKDDKLFSKMDLLCESKTDLCLR